MEVKILQIPESEFNELISKIDRLAENQNRIYDLAADTTLYDTKQLQQIMGVSQKTMQTYRDRGQIEFIQLGGLVRYTKSAFDKFLKSHSHPVKSK